METPVQKILRQNREEAHKRITEMLKKITDKDMTSLTKNEKDILKARVSYLSPEMKERYKDILLPKKVSK